MLRYDTFLSREVGVPPVPLQPPTPILLLGRITTNDTASPITWNQEDRDTEGMFSGPSTNIVVPSSLDGELLRATVGRSTSDDDGYGGFLLGGANARGLALSATYSGSIFGSEYVNVPGAPLIYANGNTLTARAIFGSAAGASVTSASVSSFAAIEKLDPSTKHLILYKSGNQGPLTAATYTNVTWGNELVNVGGWVWNGATGAITVPAGTTGLIKVTLGLRTTLSAATRQFLRTDIVINGTGVTGRFHKSANIVGPHAIAAVSAILPVSAGDTIQGRLYGLLADTIENHAHTFICVEEVSTLISRVLATKNATQNFTAYTPAAIQWDGADFYDNSSGAIHNPASNNTRFVCPSGKTFGRLTINIDDGPGAGGVGWAIEGRKNGSAVRGMPFASGINPASGSLGIPLNAIGDWVPMTPGDYFEAWAQPGNVNLGIDNSTSSAIWAQAEFM